MSAEAFPFPRVTRGRAAIDAYVDAVRERDSLKQAFLDEVGPSKAKGDWPKHNPERYSKLLLAESRVKLCNAKLNGGQLGAALRILAGSDRGDVGFKAEPSKPRGEQAAW